MPGGSTPSIPASYSAQWAQGSVKLERRWSRALGVGMVLGTIPATLLVLLNVTYIFGAVGMLWGGIANLVNRTEVFIGNGELRVRHRPVPWFGQVRCSLSNIDAFFVRERKYGKEHSFSVHLRRKQGGTLRLVEGYASADEAQRAAEVFASLVGNTSLALPPAQPEGDSEEKMR